MKNIVKLFAVVALVAVMASPLMADDKAEKKKKGKGQGRQPGAQILKQLKKAELSDEQEKQVKDIIAKHAEKLAAAQKALGGAQKTIAEARKKAAADGLKGKELKAAVAAGLTDDQKAAMAQVRELTTAVRQEIGKVLTDEQKKAAGFRAGRAPKKGKKNADKAN